MHSETWYLLFSFSQSGLNNVSDQQKSLTSTGGETDGFQSAACEIELLSSRNLPAAGFPTVYQKG